METKKAMAGIILSVLLFFMAGSAQAALINGGHVSGVISLADEADIYTFTAQPSDHVEIRAVDTSLTGDLYPQMELYGPSGGNYLAQSYADVVSVIAYTVREGGTYTLLVKHWSVRPPTTGSYDVYFARIPGANELGTLENDTVTSETIDLGDLDTYTFKAQPGDHVEIRAVDTSLTGDLYPQMELYGPSGGNYLAQNYADVVSVIAYTVTEGGTYTLLVKHWSVRPPTTGSYDVYFAQIPGANELGTLENDTVTSEAIDLGDLDTYTFKAQPGDHVEIRAVDTSLTGDLYPQMELYGPSGGNYLAQNYADVVSVIAYTITEGGTYTLLVKHWSVRPPTTGSYDVYFAQIPGANELGTLENDTVTSETIDLGDLDTYTFKAQPGDHVEIRAVDTSLTGDLYPQMELYGPSGGNYLAQNYADVVSVIAYTVTEGGTYTLLVKHWSVRPPTTGSYDVYFAQIPGANELGTLENDTVTSETIDLGDLDTYTFKAQPGDHVEIRAVDTSLTGDLYPRIELYGPSGGNYLAQSYADVVSVIAYTITEGGTYTLLVKHWSVRPPTTGSYDIYFTSIPGANELGLIYDDDTLYEIIDLGDLDTYTFIANVGENFDIQVTDISALGQLTPRIELYGPSGGSYLMSDYDNDIAHISGTVSEIGTYTVLVKDGNNGSSAVGEYEIRFVTDGDNDIDGEDLSEFIVDYANLNRPYADKDGNGRINYQDVARFAREFGNN